MPAARAPMVAVEDQTGRAVAGLGQAVGQIADAVQRQDKEEAIAWVSKASSDDHIKWMQRMAELQETAEPGAPEFTPKFLQEFDDYANEAVNNAPDQARAAYRESLTRQRTQLGGGAVTFEATKRREYIVSQYSSGVEADAATIALDPALYDERRAFRLAALNESSLPAPVKAKLIGDAEATMAYAAGAAMIDRDPHGVAAAMEAAARGDSVAGHRWISKLDSDRIQQLRTRAQTQADRIDNKARLESDKAIAAAQRAIGEMDKQIATGVPATTEDMLRWSTMTAGTEYESAYRTMLEGQQQVQEVLRMPINDQRTYVLERRLEQQLTGASTTDIANLDRIERAIETNTTMLRDSPLSWIEQRAATPIDRIDILTGLSTPDGVSSVGAAIRTRADSIHALQRLNPSSGVQMRPLMAEEAEQLSQSFKSAGAQQKRMMLGGLYWATGGQDTFDGVVDQVEGLNPFMARLGRLAGSYEESKLTNNWFSTDVVQAAGDVAAIAIHGDEILRAGGKDGAISYPVPKDADFVQAIADHVGDLYRGGGPGDSQAFGTTLGGSFMDDAYAVKAYYVGRAAQEGDLDANVNDDRLEQAISAVLGTAVDFNGQGRVLAPWGMDADAFERRANDAVLREIEDRGLGEQMRLSAGSVGLMSIGPGVYVTTLGGEPILDPKTRDLILVEMAPGADSALDTFGRRITDQIPGATP